MEAFVYVSTHMKLRVFLVLIAWLVCEAAHGADTNQINTQALRNEFRPDTGVITYQGNVLITYGPIVLTADTVEIDMQTGEALAKGNVVLQRESGELWRGERLAYNFKTRVISGDNFR